MLEDDKASTGPSDGATSSGAPFIGLATFAGLPYVEAISDLELLRPDVAIVGAPWDGSSWYRPGARFGPRQLRASALNASTYHLELGIEIFEHLVAVDFGDALCRHGLVEVSHEAILTKVSHVIDRGIMPIVLGGDHSITWPAATAVATAKGYGTVGLIHFDAHADTAASIEGNLASHGTPMRRLIESGAIPGTHFVQIGLRGYWPPASVFAWMREQGMEWYLMSEVRALGLQAIVQKAILKLAKVCSAIYLSVDIDVLDPGFAPGTGTPEPGGLSPRELFEAVRLVALSAPVIAMDIVEVCPPYDHADITINNAQRIVMEVLAGIAVRKRGSIEHQVVSKLTHE